MKIILKVMKIALFCYATILIFGFQSQTVKADVKNFNPAAYSKSDSTCVLNPDSSNKKGIQMSSSDEDSDISALKVHHILLNFDMLGMVNINQSSTAANAVKYTYNGVTYTFDRSYIENMGEKINYIRSASEYKVNGQSPAISLVLLYSKPNSSDTSVYNFTKSLIWPDAQGQCDSTHSFYALNTRDSQTQATLEAMFDYLTKYFGQKDCFVQNFIIGNEVDVPSPYNYTGTTDLAMNAFIYAYEFNLFYERMMTNSPNSKAYISLTSRWNYKDADSIGAKDFLNEFAKYEGTNDWRVAFHAFSPTFNSNTRMWEQADTSSLSYGADSPYVCGANLSVITDYISNIYGKSHHIILSEQGFNAWDNSADAQYKQAAELIYTYEAAANNPMVDGTMFIKYKDENSSLEYANLHLGLVSDSGKKRKVYQAFIDMDQNLGASEIEDIRNYINSNYTSLSKWTCKILYTGGPSLSISNPGALKLHIAANLPSNGLYSSALQYRWIEKNLATNAEKVLCDWSTIPNAIDWIPSDEKSASDYTIRCDIMTIQDSQNDCRLYGATINYHNDPVTIKGTCISKNDSKSRLFGIETNKNVDQELQYRIRVVNFEKTGSDALIFDSGLYKLSSGAALWEQATNLQQAVYSAYFAVYDSDGNLLAEQSTGFIVYDND